MASKVSSLVLQIGHQIQRLNEDLQDELSTEDRIRFLRAELRSLNKGQTILRLSGNSDSGVHEVDPANQAGIYQEQPLLDPIYTCLLDEIQALLQFEPGDHMNRQVRIIVHGSLTAAEDRSCFLKILQYLAVVLKSFSANVIRLVPVIPFASRNDAQFFANLRALDERFREMEQIYRYGSATPPELHGSHYPPYLKRVILISDDLGGQIMNSDEQSSLLFLTLRLLCEPGGFVNRYRIYRDDDTQSDSLEKWLQVDDLLSPVGEVVDPWSGPYSSIGFIHYGIDVKRINRVMKLYLYHLLIEKLAQPELIEGEYVFQNADNELEQLILRQMQGQVHPGSLEIMNQEECSEAWNELVRIQSVSKESKKLSLDQPALKELARSLRKAGQNEQKGSTQSDVISVIDDLQSTLDRQLPDYEDLGAQFSDLYRRVARIVDQKAVHFASQIKRRFSLVVESIANYSEVNESDSTLHQARQLSEYFKESSEKSILSRWRGLSYVLQRAYRELVTHRQNIHHLRLTRSRLAPVEHLQKSENGFRSKLQEIRKRALKLGNARFSLLIPALLGTILGLTGLIIHSSPFAPVSVRLPFHLLHTAIDLILPDSMRNATFFAGQASLTLPGAIFWGIFIGAGFLSAYLLRRHQSSKATHLQEEVNEALNSYLQSLKIRPDQILESQAYFREGRFLQEYANLIRRTLFHFHSYDHASGQVARRIRHELLIRGARLEGKKLRFDANHLRQTTIESDMVDRFEISLLKSRELERMADRILERDLTGELLAALQVFSCEENQEDIMDRKLDELLLRDLPLHEVERIISQHVEDSASESLKQAATGKRPFWALSLNPENYTGGAFVRKTFQGDRNFGEMFHLFYVRRGFSLEELERTIRSASQEAL